jgi:hypothetical protein
LTVNLLLFFSTSTGNQMGVLFSLNELPHISKFDSHGIIVMRTEREKEFHLDEIGYTHGFIDMKPYETSIGG